MFSKLLLKYVTRNDILPCAGKVRFTFHSAQSECVYHSMHRCTKHVCCLEREDSVLFFRQAYSSVTINWDHAEHMWGKHTETVCFLYAFFCFWGVGEGVSRRRSCVVIVVLLFFKWHLFFSNFQSPFPCHFSAILANTKFRSFLFSVFSPTGCLY